MSRFAALTLAAAALGLGGCATTGGGARPVDVTRYHLGEPIRADTVSSAPLATSDVISPEYRTYAAAVETELARLGFAPQAEDGRSSFVAGIAFRRATAGTVSTRPPFTIGFGGGSYGRGGGVGLGTSIGLGGGTRDVILTELWVQLRRRADNTVVWEGRAVTESLEGTEDGQPITVADKLAGALFKGFPGESGITITVK